MNPRFPFRPAAAPAPARESRARHRRRRRETRVPPRGTARSAPRDRRSRRYPPFRPSRPRGTVCRPASRSSAICVAQRRDIDAMESIDSRCSATHRCRSPQDPSPWRCSHAPRSRYRPSAARLRRRRRAAGPTVPSAAVRATSTAIRFAIDVPVTKIPLAPLGKPNIARVHSTIWRSTSIGM